MTINFKSWFYAVRPWTLPAAVAPVILGAAMAFGDGAGRWSPALFALFVAVMIQVGTNFVNDISDYRKGADTAGRTGPVRVIQSGMISQKVLIRAAAVVFLAAALAGLWIAVKQEAWILIPVGAACILAGILYTAGPAPAAYLGLGDLMVVVFFGPVAAAGTYYIQALTLSLPSVLAGLGCGFICCGILVVNNYRDYDGDKSVDKKTLPVRFGRTFARWEYLGLFCAAGIMPVIVFILTAKAGVLLALTAVGFSFPAVKTLFQTTDPKALNKILADTGKLLIAYALLFGIGWLV